MIQMIHSLWKDCTQINGPKLLLYGRLQQRHKVLLLLPLETFRAVYCWLVLFLLAPSAQTGSEQKRAVHRFTQLTTLYPRSESDTLWTTRSIPLRSSDSPPSSCCSESLERPSLYHQLAPSAVATPRSIAVEVQ